MILSEKKKNQETKFYTLYNFNHRKCILKKFLIEVIIFIFFKMFGVL